MVALEENADDVGRGVDLLHVVDDGRDLRQLNGLQLERPGPRCEDTIADPDPEGREGDVDVTVVLPGVEAPADRRGRRAFRRHPDDDVELLTDLHGPPERILDRKQLHGCLVGENDDVGIRRHVDLGDRPAAGDLEPVHPEVIGSAGDHHAVDELLAVAHLTADLAHRHGPADRRHVRDDPLEVLAEEAVGDAHPSVAVAAARLLRRLDAADDDARGPEILDLLLGLIAHPFPHRHEPDHGRDPDEDAKHSQRRTELVQQEAAEAEAELLEELQRSLPRRKSSPAHSAGRQVSRLHP